MHAPTSSATTPELVPVKRALISVSDKTGVVAFAKALQSEFGVELVSTGGTAKALREAGLTVRDISDVTGFPEMMDGRVKTLHPKVHGGFLALRDNEEHLAAMRQHGIEPIDLICVNLYPFEQTVAKPNCTFAEAIENIDIGGPAMIRSAAKNHRSIVVVTDAVQYDKVLKHLRANGGQTPYAFRLDLAMWAYTRTAQYDAAIYPYLAQAYFAQKNEASGGEQAAEVAGLLPALTLRMTRVETLRYGENPHQAAAFYKTSGGAGGSVARVHGGGVCDRVGVARLPAHAAAGVLQRVRPRARVRAVEPVVRHVARQGGDRHGHPLAPVRRVPRGPLPAAGPQPAAVVGV